MLDFYDLTLAAVILTVVEIIGILLAVDAMVRPLKFQVSRQPGGIATVSRSTLGITVNNQGDAHYIRVV